MESPVEESDFEQMGAIIEVAKEVKRLDLRETVENAEAAYQQLNTSMGWSAAKECLDNVFAVSSDMIYCGVAMALKCFTLLSANPKRKEQFVSDEEFDKITKLQLITRGVPGKVSRSRYSESVGKAVESVIACKEALDKNDVEQMAFQIPHMKENVNMLSRFLVNPNSTLMQDVAKEAEFKPGDFVFNVYAVFLPYVEGIKMLCAFTTLESLRDDSQTPDIEKQCDDAKDYFKYSEVERSIRHSFDALRTIRSRDTVTVTNRSLGGNWSIRGGKKSPKGLWVTCSDIQKTDGSVAKIFERDEIPEEICSQTISISETVLKIGDTVALNYLGYGYVYRFPGSWITSPDYCFYRDTVQEVKLHGGGVDTMQWRIESRYKEKGEEIRDGDEIYLHCNVQGGRDNLYLTCNYDGYVTTSGNKQVYRVNALRLMDKD